MSSPRSPDFAMPSSDLGSNLDFAFSVSSPTLNGSSSLSSTSNKPSSEKAASSGLDSSKWCNCQESQFSSIARLCNPQETPSSRGLDEVLQLTRQTSDHISSHLACGQCRKESVSFVFTAILLQRLVGLFCNIAKNGVAYVESLKFGVGVFELSAEDDARHKKLLITSAANKIEIVLGELGDTARDYQHAQILEHKNGETATESGRSNLKWVAGTIRNLQSQLKIIVSMVEAHNWGLPHST